MAAILVDTSVLMDGRIVAVAGTGFIGGTLVIPRSVIGDSCCKKRYLFSKTPYLVLNIEYTRDI